MNKLTNFLFWLAFWYNQLYIYKIYASQDVYLYSIREEVEATSAKYSNCKICSRNRSESSENKLIGDRTPNLNELELWHTSNQSYGDLVMSQIASEEEDVPIWKSIDEHLKDIDLFVNAVIKIVSELHSWDNLEVITGVSGVLMRSRRISSRSIDKRQLMYSWDTKHNQTIPIPKFVYRIIRARCSYQHGARRDVEDYNKHHNAVIVIHNDPTTGSDGDRFDCKSCSGWDAIENTYTEAGLTYVCHLTEEMSKILGIDNYDPEDEPLDLDSMDYTVSENWEWTSLTCPRCAGDHSDVIYNTYLRLKYPRKSD